MRKINNRNNIQKTLKKTIAIVFAATILSVSAVSAGAVDSTEPSSTEQSTTAPTSVNISYKGNNTIYDDTDSSAVNYTSTTASENAVLVSNGTSTLTDATITKSGDSDDNDSLDYGTNSAVLTFSNAELNLIGGYISTYAENANGVFAYGSSQINLSNTYINTSQSYSNGIVVASNGNILSKNATVSTTGEFSSAIKVGTGSGTLTADGGTFVTSGSNSPIISAKSNIKLSNAALTSTTSEGVVVDSNGDVSLKNVTLNVCNSTVSDNSDTAKNIYIYNSSADSQTTSPSFRAEGCSITTTNGDSFLVSDTAATIDLISNKIINTNGCFLRVQGQEPDDDENDENDDSDESKTIESNLNTKTVSLNLSSQKVNGDIYVDEYSGLAMALESDSVFEGAINSDNTAKKLTVTMSESSVLVLTDDTYISVLANEKTDNSNIYLNGHKLYINGKEVNANTQTYTTKVEETTQPHTVAVETIAPTTQAVDTTSNKNLTSEIFVIVGIIAGFIVIAALLTAIALKKKGYVLQKKTLTDPTDTSQDTNELNADEIPDKLSSDDKE